jgi:hypothetical protein
MDFQRDLKCGEYIVMGCGTDSNGKRDQISALTYWRNHPEKAKTQMREIWEKNKGSVLYLLRIERVLCSGSYPMVIDLPKPVERVNLTLEKTEGDDWNVYQGEE